MVLYDYIRDIRARIDDDPYGIDPDFSDAALIVFINNARRKISIDLKCWENQKHLTTELYVDEYSLPTDYLAAGDTIDVWNQIKFPPTTKISSETNKIFFDNLIQYSNLFYINETRKTITFYVPPVKKTVYPKYAISEFNREKKYLKIDGLTNINATGNVTLATTTSTVNGCGTRFLYDFDVGDTFTTPAAQKLTISSITNDQSMVVSTTIASNESNVNVIINHYTLNDLTDWDDVKGYVELSSGATKEYARISKIVQTATNVYTMYVSSYDLLGNYKNSVTGQGTVNVYSTTANVNGVSTYFTTDLKAGDLVTIADQTRSVSSITNNTFAILNSAFTANAVNQTFNVSNNTIFADNDNVRFSSYILNYSGIAKDMTYHSEVEKMPIEVAELIPVLASVECWTRKSRTDMAMGAMNEYYSKLQTVQDKINSKKADIYNRSTVRFNGDY